MTEYTYFRMNNLFPTTIRPKMTQYYLIIPISRLQELSFVKLHKNFSIFYLIF